MEDLNISKVQKIEEENRVGNKHKKRLIIVLVGILLTLFVAAVYIFWKKTIISPKTIESQSNTNSVVKDEESQDRDEKFVFGESNFEDRSFQNPIDTNLDESPEVSLRPVEKIKLYFISAKKGTIFNQAGECDGIVAQKEEDFDIDKELNVGVCVGGFAANANSQSLCETYDFKAKYRFYPLCNDCGEERNFVDGNSAFESCFIGYGIVKKDERACLNLPDATDRKNVPDYEDDKTPTREMKQEGCIYGAAIGKNNYKLCEYSGFFKDSCYYSFAVYRKMGDLCDKISSSDIKNKCVWAMAALKNNEQ